MNVNRHCFEIVNQADWYSSENTVVIIGAALDGPAGVPILVNDKYDPIDLFGKSPLSDAYTAVRRATTSKIITYRMNGIHSTATITSGTQDVIKFTSISAGVKYNDIAITVNPDYIYIDETAVGGSTRSYFFDQYPTAYDLAYGINRDSFYGLVSFRAESLVTNFTMMNVVSTQTFINFDEGSDEEEFFIDRTIENPSDYYSATMKQRLIETLFGSDPDDQAEFVPNGSLSILNYGVIVLADMFHDESQDYADLLGNFCLNKSKMTDSGCIGVIGTSPLYDTSDTSILAKVDNLNSIASIAEVAEQDKYVQIVVGDSFYSNDMPLIPNAYSYAGAQSFYPYSIMMTNKKISGFGYLNWQISKEDIALLLANGYICIVPSIRRGFVPYQSSTYYKDKTSPMSKPHCVRISLYAAKSLMFGFDGLVGSVSNYYTEKEIIKTAENILQEMVNEGAIQSFAVTCDFTPGDKEVTINTSVVPYSEITAVNTSTTIAFPREVI